MKFIIFTLFTLALSACEKYNVQEACNSDNPLEDLVWLSDLKRDFDNNKSETRQQIIQYTYKGQRVFVVDACYQCPDGMTYVYDCEENTLCIFGGIGGFDSCPDFSNEISEEVILYNQ